VAVTALPSDLVEEMPELDAAGGRYSGVSAKRGGRRLVRQTVDFSDVVVSKPPVARL